MIFAAVVVAGSGFAHPVVAASPAPIRAHIWPHFLKPTKADYDRKNLTPQQRLVIDTAVLTARPSDREYVRWEMWYGDVIVFVANPDQLRSDGRSFEPSEAINYPNFFVDPADGSVFAWPPFASPRIYASRWDPTCRGLFPIFSPPPGLPGEHRSKIQARLWPGFLRPAIVDYDSEHLDTASRDLIDRIVVSLPTAERPNVRWIRDGDGVAVFEVTLAQFCPGSGGTKASPIINEDRRYVIPTTGELITAPPE